MRIISGGQTGADRGGLDAAIELGIPHGGWCPLGRRSEDVIIPSHYQLTEAPSPQFGIRTEFNIRDSDLTILFTRGAPTGDSRRTWVLANDLQKNFYWIDLTGSEDPIDLTYRVLAHYHPKVLNIAGSRESKAPGIQEEVKTILVQAITKYLWGDNATNQT